MTSIDDALQLLSSPASSERLRGARIAEKYGTSGVVGRLRQLRGAEDDSWVRAALDQAISRLQSTGTPNYQPDILWPDSLQHDEITAIAIENVTELIIHEISPQIRRILLRAQVELGASFDQSKTKIEITWVSDFLKVLRRLHEAAGSPDISEFDLTALLNEIVAHHGYSSEQVLVPRADPVTVRGDSDLISLAISNGLSNAVEASTKSKNQVVVTFGRTDIDAWVAILDEGEGLPGGESQVWKPGRTTKGKDNHFGWGLTIARRSMTSMQGTITLSPREPRGVSCEIRWPHPKEES